MTKIAVVGVAGRMGANIARLCQERSDVVFVGGTERPGQKVLGETLYNQKVSSDLSELLIDANAVIDFSIPEVTLNNVEACLKAKKAIVIGTTGFDATQLAVIQKAAQQIPIVLAPNMGLGVNVLMKLVKLAAEALHENFDIEIVEAHHRHKVDAPSGTALGLAKEVAAGMQKDLDDIAVYERHGIIGERKKGSLGIQTLRGGDIVGKHTVLYAGAGESIELTHQATSRDTFANGAITAAIWLQKQEPGFYDMQDVLGLNV